MLGNCVASAGMDNTVKIWALDTPDIQDAIKESYSWSPAARCDFKTRFVQFPAFSTSKVLPHTRCVVVCSLPCVCVCDGCSHFSCCAALLCVLFSL